MNKILIYIVLMLLSCVAKAVDISPRIVGGIDTNVTTLPWQAHLEITFVDGGSSSTFVCGGVVVSTQHVLTAAHCLENNGETATAANIDVWTGISLLSSATSSSAHRVSRVVLHPSYNSARFTSDIAVLTLSTPISDSALPILMANDEQQQRADTAFDNGWVTNGERVGNLLVSGWGSTVPDSRSARSNQLQSTVLSGVPDDICDSLWGSGVTSSDAPLYVCAASVSPDLVRDSCFGDSGGPLIWQDPQRASDSDFGLRLVGLVSFGAGSVCGVSTPGVYTEISNFKSWVESQGVSTPSTPGFTSNPFGDDFTGAGSDIELPTSSASSGSSGGGGGGGSIGWLTMTLLGLGLYRRLK